MRYITSVAQLRRAIADGHHEYYVLLNGGVYSVKTITFASKKRFRVHNHIDDTEQVLSEEELSTMSNIGEAMKRRAFVCK